MTPPSRVKEEENMKQSQNKRLNHIVFWPPFLILFGAVLFSFIHQKGFATAMNTAYDRLSQNFGWLYLSAGLLIVLILAVIFCTKAGSIRFGGKNARSPYSFWN